VLGRWLTGLTAAGMATGALVSSSVAASESAVVRFAPKVAPTITITIVSVSPQPPNAGEQFELVARVEFAPAPGSIHCFIRVGERLYHAQRLTWENPIARCTLRVPSGSRGKRLSVRLEARLGGSRASSALAFRVS
jgi:hypothetical protein